MKNKLVLIILLLMTIAGCGESESSAQSKVPTPARQPDQPPAQDPTRESVGFEKKQIRIGDRLITVEVADTDARREQGLMFRTELPDDRGMLFVFEDTRQLSFWMKNTLIPLSIGYFDRNKKLLETYEMVLAVIGEREIKTYPSRSPAMYALEMPKGWFARHGIHPGTVFSFVGKP